MRSPLLGVLMTVAVAVQVGAGETFTPPNPSPLPAPKVKLPAMPADGSGIYRLSLEGLLGPTTLTVLIDVRDGRPRAAVALPLQNQRSGWWPGKTDELKYVDGALQGAILFDCMPVPMPINKRVFPGKPASREVNTRYVPFVLEPQATATVTLDVGWEGNFGRGACTLTVEGCGKLPGLNIQAGEAIKGKAYLVREPHAVLSDDYQCELCFRQVLPNAGVVQKNGRPLTPPDDLWCRIDVQHGRVKQAALYAWWRQAPLVMSGQSLTVKDGRVSGSMDVAWPGLEGQPVTLKVDTTIRMGRRLCGRVTCVRGTFRETTPWVGVLQALRDSKLPVEMPGDFTWEWNQGIEPDTAMSAQAMKESLQPVMPGEPGRAGFWTWRPIARHGGGTVSCIYPPSFGLQEVKGAVRYRFDVTQEKGSPFKLSFELEKPWHSLAAAWDKIPVHDKFYPAAVTPLDAGSNAIRATMQMRIMDKEGQPALKDIPEGTIKIHKRPPFTGPMAKTDRPWSEAALLLGRALRDVLTRPEGRGSAMAISKGRWGLRHSDHGFVTSWAASLWGSLACRAETTDPAERQWAEEMVHFHLADVTAHLGGKPTVPYEYQHQTPLAHWAVEAMCDAFLQTGNVDFKKQALLAARGICALQCPDGSFASDLGARGPPESWYGSCKKLKHYPTFATPELLYALGRARRDFGTDEFAKAERKAHDWALEHCVKGRFWPLHVCHSASQKYPNTMHANTALYYCRYLLECAPEDRRDLKLAEEIARWGEDYGVSWHRGDGRPQTIYPRINAGDRYNNAPMVNNVLAAIVFEELAQATGDKLWSAKGEALAVAAVQGISPDGRVANVYLIAETPGPAHHSSFNLGWAAQLLREYAMLRAMRDSSSPAVTTRQARDAADSGKERADE